MDKVEGFSVSLKPKDTFHSMSIISFELILSDLIFGVVFFPTVVSKIVFSPWQILGIVLQERLRTRILTLAEAYFQPFSA